MSGQGEHSAVVIVGAGFGGLGMAAALKRVGVDSFTVFEKGEDVGGIWRENTYPGCGCDVPSHLYSFSFAPYRSSTVRYPGQRDILGYLQRTADREGLRRHLRTGTEIASAEYDETAARWTLTTRAGERHTADVVVFAVGQLHRPKLPDITGHEDFAGPAFHTARWDHGQDLRGRTVAVIGTGSSAAQLVPRVADTARRVTVYQRTANWVIPKPAANFHPLVQRAFDRVPTLQSAYRAATYLAADLGLSPVVSRGWSARPLTWLARRHLRRQVPDPVLRTKLTPDHPIGCKRVVIDSAFYPALRRANVDLVTDPIDRIDATGIRTADGAHRAADVIVYATGFRASEFLVPVDVRGRGGTRLHDRWSGGAEAYLGIAYPEFPNMFLLHGPNTILGHNSNVFVIECQVHYIMNCLRLLRGTTHAIEVRHEAMAEYRRWLDRTLAGTVWEAGCQSWYQNPAGRVTNPWPASTMRYRRLSRQDPRPAFRPSIPT
jgi:cation diffusion facilitator CzcD-associated flavoprotein CzcO